MDLRKTLKKGKLAVTSLALGGALLAGGCSKENTEEVKDIKAKQEQRVEGKSEMRQKIAYLDEYVAAVEAGKDKDQAYQEFALKMADGNAKKMAEMQKQIEAMQKEIKDSKQEANGESFVNTINHVLVAASFLLLAFGYCPKVNKELDEHTKKIAALEKTKKDKVY